MRQLILAIPLAALALSSAAGSRGPKVADPSGKQLQGILACQGTTDATRRLACFDEAAAGLAASVQRKDIVVIDRAQAREARRSLFGFALPSLPMLDAAGSGPDDRQVADTVASARTDRDGAWIVTLRSGAVWQQTDGQVVARAPRAGDDVVITRGAFGSYFMRIGKQPGIKVRRQG